MYLFIQNLATYSAVCTSTRTTPTSDTPTHSRMQSIGNSHLYPTSTSALWSIPAIPSSSLAEEERREEKRVMERRKERVEERGIVKRDERRYEERQCTRAGSSCKCPKSSNMAHTTPSLTTIPNKLKEVSSTHWSLGFTSFSKS